MVLLPGCGCCGSSSCGINPIGLTSSSYTATDSATNILLQEIWVTVSVPNAAERGFASGVGTIAEQPNRYNRVTAEINTVPSSGVYVLTKSAENTNYADYYYGSYELVMTIRVQKQSYICWLQQTTDYEDYRITFGNVGERLSYSQGVFPSSDFYEIPSVAFVKSRPVQSGIGFSASDEHQFRVEKYRTAAGSQYAARPTSSPTGWKVFGQQLAGQFQPVLKTGPITTLDAQLFQATNRCGATSNGWVYGPCSSSGGYYEALYDFYIPAIECIYSGGLPNRSAFTDA